MDLSHIDTASIQDLRQVSGQSVRLVQHLHANLQLTATPMAVDCNYLWLQYNQEQIAQQIAPNLLTQYDSEIQWLQIRNQETTTESNASQESITTLSNELNDEYGNAEVLRATAVGGLVPRQQPHIQPVSIPDLQRFDGDREKLYSCFFHLCMK
jgi:hypothetical protein